MSCKNLCLLLGEKLTIQIDDNLTLIRVLVVVVKCRSNCLIWLSQKINLKDKTDVFPQEQAGTQKFLTC
jgi:hypothetical protein